MNETFIFTCPSCGKKLKALPSQASRKGRCPCGQLFLTPEPPVTRVVPPVPVELHSGITWKLFTFCSISAIGVVGVLGVWLTFIATPSESHFNVPQELPITGDILQSKISLDNGPPPDGETTFYKDNAQFNLPFKEWIIGNWQSIEDLEFQLEFCKLVEDRLLTNDGTSVFAHSAHEADGGIIIRKEGVRAFAFRFVVFGKIKYYGMFGSEGQVTLVRNGDELIVTDETGEQAKFKRIANYQ